jgi:hypothetical protein
MHAPEFVPFRWLPVSASRLIAAGMVDIMRSDGGLQAEEALRRRTVCPINKKDPYTGTSA